MVGNAGVSNGTQEDCVERAQLLDAIVRHHLASLDVGFAAPIKGVPVEMESKTLSCRFQNSNAFGYDFFANTVASDDRDVELLHDSFVPSLGGQQR